MIHKRKHIRLQNFNYGLAGLYFVTICTADRKNYFGEIHSGEMHLSIIGKNASEEWMNTIELRPDMNIGLYEFVVRPNHVR